MERAEHSRRARRGIAFAVLLLLISGLSMSGCSQEQALVRRKDQQQETLQEAADGYWHAVRWCYFDKAVAFVESSADKARLLEYLLSRERKASINEQTVYRVVQSKDLDTAKVYVSYELMLPTEARVIDRRVEQDWYVRGGKWFLRLKPEELERLE